MANNSIFRNIFTSISILSILCISINAFFIYPSADDYSYYVSVNEKGFWNFQEWHYLNWGGRYIPNALLGSFSFDGYGIGVYRAIAIGVVIGLFSSIVVFVRKVFKLTEWYATIYTSSILFLGYTLSLYSISQQFYWLPGSLTYTFSCIISLLVWSFLKEIDFKSFIPIFIGVFIINGTNEISILLFNFSLILLALYHWIQNKKLSPLFYGIMLCSFVFGAISILAPGNTVRAESIDYPNTKNLIFSISRTINRSIILILEHLYNVLFIIIALIPLLDKLPQLKINIPHKIRPFIQWGILLFPLGVLFLGVFPNYWATGRIPPQRTINTATFFFMMAGIFSLIMYHSNFRINDKIVSYLKQRNIGVWLMLGAFLLLPNYLKLSIQDLFTGKSYQFSQQMKARIEFVENSSEDELEVEEIVYPSIAFKELSEDKNYYYNQAYAKYYKKKSIILKKK